MIWIDNPYYIKINLGKSKECRNKFGSYLPLSSKISFTSSKFILIKDLWEQMYWPQWAIPQECSNIYFWPKHANICRANILSTTTNIIDHSRKIHIKRLQILLATAGSGQAQNLYLPNLLRAAMPCCNWKLKIFQIFLLKIFLKFI